MESPIQSLVGSLLLASSVITDPNFRKAVVLVADHGSEGAFGLVLNHTRIFAYRPPTKAFNLKLSFAKTRASRDEIIDALEAILKELRKAK